MQTMREKDDNIMIRIMRAEKEKIEDAANIQGKKVSAYILEAVFAYMGKCPCCGQTIEDKKK